MPAFTRRDALTILASGAAIPAPASLAWTADLPSAAPQVAAIEEAASASCSDFQIAQAYREFLHYEGRILGRELYPEMGSEARHCIAETFASKFHFPDGVPSWEDVPKPSTRATLILRAVGLLPQQEPGLVGEAIERARRAKEALLEIIDELTDAELANDEAALADIHPRELAACHALTAAETAALETEPATATEAATLLDYARTLAADTGEVREGMLSMFTKLAAFMRLEGTSVHAGREEV